MVQFRSIDRVSKEYQQSASFRETTYRLVANYHFWTNVEKDRWHWCLNDLTLIHINSMKSKSLMNYVCSCLYQLYFVSSLDAISIQFFKSLSQIVSNRLRWMIFNLDYPNVCNDVLLLFLNSSNPQFTSRYVIVDSWSGGEADRAPAASVLTQNPGYTTATFGV